MKKKYIALSISIIIIISILAIIIKNNNKEYIMQDGVMLALTLDGEKITEYPEGTNYGVEINCENGKGKWLVEEWKLAVEEITGNVVCNIDFTSNPKSLKSKVEEVNVNNNFDNNGYRYSGRQPNNYIWFNNEMWRIIGSIPTCLTATCGTNTTNLVKIIRNDSIGGISNDGNSSTGAWGSNTLYTLLKTYYLGKGNASGTSYCYTRSTTAIGYAKCDYRVKGIGSTSYYGKMIKNVYWNTGASDNSVNAVTAYTNEIATRTVSGKVGLMTASDYGYATSSSYHSVVMSNKNASRTSENWLGGQAYEWTSIQGVDYTVFALYIDDTGVLKEDNAHYGYAVRPVVYLDSSVYIISGDGSITNPYQIGM